MTTRTSAFRRLPATLAGGAMLAVSALALAGCTAPAASGASGGGPEIVATTTQVGDFTRELVGDSAEVTQLLSPGQSAHSFDPSAAQLLALSQADALVVNGGGLESWLDDAVQASGFDGVLIDASTGIELHGTDDHGDADAHDHDDDHDDAHDESAATDAADDDHAEHDDADHDHGAGNPHIWTDPELAEHMVENIADGLADVPGVDAAAIAQNETDYLAKLDALDDWITENVETVPAADRLLVTNHDAFTYFIDAYDVTFVGSVIPSFDDNAEPSAAEIDALVDRIRATGATAVFSEASISPKAAETIAAEAGVTVFSGPDALYGDSLGVEGSEGATYLGSQLHNARLILESWGVTPTALPEALQG
ncbi:zinc/manganese transport system substrate-binding protein/manganese/iron transport system substrate-binding protein [Agromyces hippuratus]|uniref:Zinc/manganese transport system substrate-binding protein/manganese/iron transport system substrate-binding protein n=1 Tax=Agromyces hippuratus TaxID=286438 RepID=A0A852WZM6_9MICO|nr:metal ABC transporter substrate-binding protein [Agromyces hippuratus]NYG21660.1 zinc/manganese transport system substrate-binding protein/manganese/iron transport system substrate-binding protein [Agromyces hippuratus]